MLSVAISLSNKSPRGRYYLSLRRDNGSTEDVIFEHVSSHTVRTVSLSLSELVVNRGGLEKRRERGFSYVLLNCSSEDELLEVRELGCIKIGQDVEERVAKRKTAGNESMEMPRIVGNGETLLIGLSDLYSKGEKLLGSLSGIRTKSALSSAYDEISSWTSDTCAVLSTRFSNERFCNEFSESICFGIMVLPESLQEEVEGARDRLKTKLRRLDGIIKMAKAMRAVEDEEKVSNMEGISGAMNLNIFIVHGHRDVFLNEVEMFIRRQKLEPIILSQQVNGGRTLPEKFEDHASDAKFAVVLLTADDVGASGSRSHHNALQPRARQNAYVELGFFWGRLSRKRVCVIYEKDVELPSDLHGVVYIQYDEHGKWKNKLLGELETAGYPVKHAVI